MKKDVYKNRITLNLGKVHTKTSFSTTRNNVLNNIRNHHITVLLL